VESYPYRHGLREGYWPAVQRGESRDYRCVTVVDVRDETAVSQLRHSLHWYEERKAMSYDSPAWTIRPIRGVVVGTCDEFVKKIVQPDWWWT